MDYFPSIYSGEDAVKLVRKQIAYAVKYMITKLPQIFSDKNMSLRMRVDLDKLTERAKTIQSVCNTAIIMLTSMFTMDFDVGISFTISAIAVRLALNVADRLLALKSVIKESEFRNIAYQYILQNATWYDAVDNILMDAIGTFLMVSKNDSKDRYTDKYVI